jgi:integrase
MTTTGRGNAVMWGLVSRNVAELVTLPRKKRYEAQILTLQQAQKLLEVARGSRLEALLMVALTIGMRRGELLALHWDDVNFEEGTLYVRHTMNNITGLGYVVGEPKSWAGHRKIVLSDVTIEALRQHQKYQAQLREKAGEKWLDQGIVFCNTFGSFFNPSNMLVAFKQLLHEAGLPKVRFHDLRHSAATILAAARVDLKTIQERLGHSTIATTADIYSHALPKMQQEAASKIDDLFNHSST